MARILYAWELGAGMGHIEKVWKILAELRRRGHEVIAVARDHELAERRFGPLGIVVRPAPKFFMKVIPTPATYAGMLAVQGWTQPAALVAAAMHWKAIVDEIRPDLALVDHGPTVLLVLRGSGVPTAVLGSGWAIPPLSSPLPRLTMNGVASEKEVAATAVLERGIVRCVNSVTKSIGVPPLEVVADLFAGATPFLLTFPELDHYGRRRPEPTYWGPQMLLNRGRGPTWSGTGRRVAGYLKTSVPGALALVEAIRQRSDIDGLLYLAGADPATCAALSSPTLTVVHEPLDLDAVLGDAEVLISHAGMGTVSAGVLHGCAQLVVPAHLEQHVIGVLLSRLGVGGAVTAPDSDPGRSTIDSVIGDTSMLVAARVLADRHAGFDQAVAAAAITDECEALIGRSH